MLLKLISLCSLGSQKNYSHIWICAKVNVYIVTNKVPSHFKDDVFKKRPFHLAKAFTEILPSKSNKTLPFPHPLEK